MKNLESLSYKELQELAKSAGIRANQKGTVLLQSLKQHFDKESNVSEKPEQDNEKTPVIPVQMFYNSPKPSKGSHGSKVIRGGSTGEVDPIHNKDHKEGPTSQLKRKSKSIEFKESSTKKRKSSVQSKTPILKGRKSSSNSRVLEKLKTPVRKSAGKAKRSVSAGKAKRSVSPKQKTDRNGAKEIISELHADMSRQELKDRLRAVLDNKIPAKSSVKPKADEGGSNIPRFMAFLKNKEKERQMKEQVKSKQPRFESIVDYEKRKKERAEKLLTPIKVTKSSSKSPKTLSTRLFKPTVTSASKINTNFSKAQLERKRSVVIKTPEVSGRKSTISRTQTPGARPSIGTSKSRYSVLNANKQSTTLNNRRFSSSVTPLKTSNAMNTSSLNSSISARPTFDLKSSLSKPLSYKPHSGLLKPVGQQPSYTGSHRKPVKTITLAGRQGRRTKVQQNRQSAREKEQMSRRGIHF